MAKLKPKEQKKGLPEWMASYADMVTLLMTFFVLLFAMSNLEEEKFRALADSYTQASSVSIITGGQMLDGVGSALLPVLNNEPAPTPEPTPTPGAPPGSVVSDADLVMAQKMAEQADFVAAVENAFKTYLAENEVSEVLVENFGDHLRVTFTGDMLFASGQANLSQRAMDALDVVAVELLKYPEAAIRVEGHTDNVPHNREPYRSNLMLSSARAVSVARYLIENKHFDPKRISAEGKGEYWPVDPNADNNLQENRDKNRRVELKIYY